jgi:hypothetical protein
MGGGGGGSAENFNQSLNKNDHSLNTALYIMQIINWDCIIGSVFRTSSRSRVGRRTATWGATRSRRSGSTRTLRPRMCRTYSRADRTCPTRRHSCRRSRAVTPWTRTLAQGTRNTSCRTKLPT